MLYFGRCNFVLSGSNPDVFGWLRASRRVRESA